MFLYLQFTANIQRQIGGSREIFWICMSGGLGLGRKDKELRASRV
jgi:hypothetical protein